MPYNAEMPYDSKIPHNVDMIDTAPLRPLADGRLYGRLYGRRQSHKLSRRQMRLVEDHLPSLRMRPYARAPLQAFDFTPKKLALEIGFGGGEHLAGLAARAPDTGFIGCEPFRNGVAKLIDAIVSADLNNIRIHDNDACELMACLPDSCLDEVWLLYPDPWPKRCHHKRRFINPHNLGTLFRLLKPHGHFIMASDVPAYIEWSLRHIDAHGGFVRLATPFAETPQGGRNFEADSVLEADSALASNIEYDALLHSPVATRYESKALRQGRQPTRLIFRRRK